MNDDLQQIREEIFDRVVFGLALIGLVGALVALVIDQFLSAWFLRAVALLIVTLVAFTLRRGGQFAVATYVLVLELIGVVAGIFVRTGALTDFTPYLFIPIVIIAGLILNPLAAIVTAVFSIFVVAGLVAFTKQLTPANLSLILPPFALTLLTAVLTAEGGRFIELLVGRSLENKELLQERTLEMWEALEKAEKLRHRAEKLEQELLQAQTEASRTQQMATRRDNGLYDLVKGVIQELDASVKGLQEIIEKSETGLEFSEQASLFEEAWQRIHHLTSLVVNLEEMAQLENHRISLNYRSIDVAVLISEVVGTARGLAREKNLELRYRLPEDLPRLQADPIRVRQALAHVLSNAIKYTDEGIIEVQTELTNGQELIIFVSDTGIGMYREEMGVIFQKFGRGRGPLAKQRQGPGLGLAISKALIKLHGGRMWVSSVLGVGSTFYMTLPLSPPPDQAPAALPITTPSIVPDPQTVPAPSPEREPAYPASLAVDDEATLLSSELDTKELPTVELPDIGSRLARFGSTYINRFDLILLSLLLIIAGMVAVLAIFSRPDKNENAVGEQLSPTSNVVVDLPVSPTRLPAATATLPPAITPAARPTLPPTPTLVTTSQPSAALTSLPTESPAPSPTNTPAAAPPKPTAASSPVPTQTPSPTLPSLTQTPTQPPAAVPEPSQATVEPTAGVQPSIAPTRRLSFIVDRDGNQAVALHSPGDEPGPGLAIAVGTVNNSGLSWSPGGQLLFTTDRDGDREIYISNADGSQPRRLTQIDGDDNQPAWSPDGRKIAFSSGRNGNFDIYVMDADGGNLLQLTTSRGFDEWPVWSADGRKIAFVSDRDGNPEIYTMNVDGSHQQRLTDHPADDWPAFWSPDGSKLVFSSNRDSNWNLYLVDAAGGSLPLTNDPANERQPAWSPDGRTIAFAYDGAGNWDIYTMPAPTGRPTEIPRDGWTQITNTPVDEQYPAWLP